MRERTVRGILERLLHVYPASFRWELGDDLVRTATARWSEARLRSGQWGEVVFWLTEGRSFVLDGLAERLRSLVAAGAAELTHAIRQVARTPRHHALAVGTLALGIGATATILTITDHTVLRPLPYPDAHRLYLVQTRFGAMEMTTNSLPNLVDVREQVDALSWIAAVNERSPALSDESGQGTERIPVLDVGPEYLPGLGARAATGRSFMAEDFTADAERVAIVSHGLWQGRWGGSRTVLGGQIVLNGTAHTVVGVMDPDFRDPDPLITGEGTGAWIPIRSSSGAYHNRDYYGFRWLARLADGATPALADAQLALAGASLSEAHPVENRPDGQLMGFALYGLHEATTAEARPRMLLLLGAVILLLLLACANVASLFLARGLVRSHELAVRAALGATRRRVAVQLFAECLLTAALAGVLGSALALYGTTLFAAIAPAGMPRLQDVTIDVRILGFIVLLTVAVAVAFGTIPALRAAAMSGSEPSRGRIGDSRTAQRLQTGLLAVEVALALVLVTGSMLLGGSLRNMLLTDPGFDADGVVVLDVRPPRSAATHAGAIQFYETLAERIAGVPGVAGAAAIHTPPGMREGAWSRITADHARDAAAVEQPRAPAYGAQPGNEYLRVNPVRGSAFSVLGMRFVAGQDFAGEPAPGDPLEVVINESAARRLFGDAQAAIGRGLILGAPGSDAPLRRVVGVVADIRQHAAAASPEATVYLPYGQKDTDHMHVVARFTPASTVDLPAIVALVRDVTPDVPVDRLDLLARTYAETAGTQRFLVFMLGALAVLGLVLSMLGTYATASQTFARRLRDLAVRAALGAGAVGLFTHVLQRALAAVAWGLTAGLLVSGIFSRFLEAYLYGIGARDSRTFALAAGLIAASALLASFAPAARAARLDPNEVLRGD